MSWRTGFVCCLWVFLCSSHTQVWSATLRNRTGVDNHHRPVTFFSFSAWQLAVMTGNINSQGGKNEHGQIQETFFAALSARQLGDEKHGTAWQGSVSSCRHRRGMLPRWLLECAALNSKNSWWWQQEKWLLVQPPPSRPDCVKSLRNVWAEALSRATVTKDAPPQWTHEENTVPRIKYITHKMARNKNLRQFIYR